MARDPSGVAEPSASQSPGAADLLVKVLSLPTTSPRKARAAVLLQLDRLCSLPPQNVAFDVTLLGPGPGGDSTWGIGIIRTDRIQFLAAGSGNARHVAISTAVDGRPVTFRFPNPLAGESARAAFLEKAPQRLAILSAAALLSLALASRLSIELDRAEARLQQVVSETRAVQRAAAERQASQAAWASASQTKVLTQMRCVLESVGAAAPGSSIASLESRESRTTVVLAGQLGTAAASTLSAMGAEVTLDPGQEPRTLVQLPAFSCVAVP